MLDFGSKKGENQKKKIFYKISLKNYFFFDSSCLILAALTDRGDSKYRLFVLQLKLKFLF